MRTSALIVGVSAAILGVLPAAPAAAGAAPSTGAATVTRTTAAAVTTTAVPAAASTTDLAEFRRLRVYFGHQSVGWNILDGTQRLYRARRMTAPTLREWSASLPSRGAYLAQSGIGENGNPVSKINDFVAKVRSGTGARVQVAFMKFCFVDVTAGTNVTDLFRRYRLAVASLQARYPRLVLLHLTVPLTTRDAVADNVTRERFNALMRGAYGRTGRLVDLAAVESTTPTGARVTGVSGGRRWYALWPGYTTDGGHLNTLGSVRAADLVVRVVARAVP